MGRRRKTEDENTTLPVTANGGELSPLIEAGAAIAPTPAALLFESWLNPEVFNQIQRVAQVFAESDMVPDQYKGKVANCVIGLQMAYRLKVDPMMLMQTTYVVHGKPGMEAKLAIALVQSSGRIEGGLKWRFSGDRMKPGWVCECLGKEKWTGDILTARVSWDMAQAEGWTNDKGSMKSKWKTMPEQMMQYRSATFWARLHDPGAILGMRTVDELDDIRDVEYTDIGPTRLIQEPKRLSETQDGESDTEIPPTPDTPVTPTNKPEALPRRRGRPRKDESLIPPVKITEPEPAADQPEVIPPPPDITNSDEKIRRHIDERLAAIGATLEDFAVYGQQLYGEQDLAKLQQTQRQDIMTRLARRAKENE